MLVFMIKNKRVTIYQVSFDITILYVLTYIIDTRQKYYWYR
jgi:hypothetical protein